jgi:hypothetical protein
MSLQLLSAVGSSSKNVAVVEDNMSVIKECNKKPFACREGYTTQI